ncbi:hypothetical protein [Rhodococcus xishaensis]|uniref:Uncharacterized protein n=1 Tax=Rhodococcus xishaensis TaxID=2487364 RepID=A0A438AT96_9NOCA|nr:hypothetical protein [Rhodococcus xishaensis]RVW02023.1 hypothetical protein EGT50_11370 [Rhodococcus xishaensis]
MRQKFRKTARVVAVAAALTLASGLGGAVTASAAELESTPSVPGTQSEQSGPDALLQEEGLLLEEGLILDDGGGLFFGPGGGPGGGTNFGFPLL